MPLTYKMRLFVSAYLGQAHGNATEAARVAGYHHPSQLGHQLLQKTSIQAAIDRRVESAAMSADEVLARMGEQAQSDLGHFLEIRPLTN